jgi:hypothetical protein
MELLAKAGQNAIWKWSMSYRYVQHSFLLLIEAPGIQY